MQIRQMVQATGLVLLFMRGEGPSAAGFIIACISRKYPQPTGHSKL